MSEYQKIALWQELEGKINAKNEFNAPHGNASTAPELGEGSIRWNPDTKKQEVYDGTAWVATGTGTGGDTVTGTYTTTGDGKTASFAWPHGLGFNPTATGFTIDPVTTAAQGPILKSADSTNFTVYYDIRPKGTLTFNTTAKIP